MSEKKSETKKDKKNTKNDAVSVKHDIPEGVTGVEKNGIMYYEIIATCACGAQYKTGSTQPKIRVDICANCHPFFTGEQRLLDSEGRIDKFNKRYNKATS